jgi:hypothetical protein
MPIFTIQSNQSSFLTGGVVTPGGKIRFDNLDIEFCYDGNDELKLMITPETKFFFVKKDICFRLIPIQSFNASSITDANSFYATYKSYIGGFVLVQDNF